MNFNILIYNFLILTLFQFCQPNNLEMDKMNVKIGLYPSSGGDIVYSIEIHSDSLIIKKIMNEEIKKQTIFQEHLTKAQVERVNKLIKSIKKRENTDTEIVLDSWRIELKINNKIYYNKSDIRIKTLPSDIRSLVEYLINLSNVKIELDGFA